MHIQTYKLVLNAAERWTFYTEKKSVTSLWVNLLSRYITMQTIPVKLLFCAQFHFSCESLNQLR